MSHCWSPERGDQHVPLCWLPRPSFISFGLGCPNVASALLILSSCLTVLGFLNKWPCYKLCFPTIISLPIVCVKAHSRATGILKLLWFEFGESRQLRRERIQPLYLSDPRESTALVIDILPKLYEMWNTVEYIAQSILSVSCLQTAMKIFYCLVCDKCPGPSESWVNLTTLLKLCLEFRSVIRYKSKEN